MWVYVWVHLDTYAEYIEIGEREDVHFVHEWLGVCSGWGSVYDPDDPFVCFDERLYIHFPSIVCAPYCDGVDEVWENVLIVQFLHHMCGQVLTSILEAVYGWL